MFGLDEELLMMVPQPCIALCLLYPSAKITPARRKDQAEKMVTQPVPPPELFFCMQHDNIGNACGTIACMHAVANGVSKFGAPLVDGPLARFIESTREMDVATRGKALLAATDLQEMSDATAASGTTEGAGTDDAQGQHFIAFVNCGGSLYELDGRNFDKQADGATAKPFCHGTTTDETFLTDAAKVIREDVMARDPDSINFNITALCKC